MKEVDYTAKLMSTYGGMTIKNGWKYSKIFYNNNNRYTKTTTFNYTKPFCHHFLCHHAVYKHNKLHQISPYIEENWIMQHWLNQVSEDLIAISEVNTFLAYN